MISTSVSWRWCGGKWRSSSLLYAPGAGSWAYCSRYVAWFRNGLHGGLKAGRAGVLMHNLTLPVPLVTHLQQLNLHSAVVPHSTRSISLQKGDWTLEKLEDVEAVCVPTSLHRHSSLGSLILLLTVYSLSLLGDLKYSDMSICKKIGKMIKIMGFTSLCMSGYYYLTEKT